MTGIYGDADIISAWVSTQTIMACIYMLGVGFASAIRTFVGIEIGRKRIQNAKKFAEWGILLNFLTMAIICINISIFSDSIARFFTNIESTKSVISILMFYYGIVGGFDCCLWNFSTLLRYANQIMYLNINALLVQFLIPVGMCALGLFVFD